MNKIKNKDLTLILSLFTDKKNCENQSLDENPNSLFTSDVQSGERIHNSSEQE